MAIKLTKDEHLKLCYESPAFFAKEVLGLTPTPQQLQLMNAIKVPGAHVAVASGHGIGKSTVLAALALWFLATREDAKVPCTAPTGHQLEDILWAEIKRLVLGMAPAMRDQFRVSKQRVEMIGSSGFIVARTARPENPDALQGFHSANLMFLIDEAAGVDEEIFKVAYGALSTADSRAIMTGNPTQLRGFFHKTFHSDNSWIKFQFSSEDSPIVDPAIVESFAKDFGADSDTYRVRVLGQFPRAGMHSIIPAHLVDQALGRRIREEDLRHYAALLGVDPAWEGADRSTIVLRQGRYARVLHAQVGLAGDTLAKLVHRYAQIHNAERVFVDKAGVGASCCDFLRTYNVPHVRVSFSESPMSENFLNKRCEIWWAVRDWLENESPTLVDFPGLRDDLVAPEYGLKDSGKLYLESKEQMRKRGIKSPDLGDALALTFSMGSNQFLRANSIGGSKSRKTGHETAWLERWKKGSAA